MKVLLFTENEYYGGVTTFVKILAANQILFSQSNIELRFATLQGNPVSKEYPSGTDFLKIQKLEAYNDTRCRFFDKNGKFNSHYIKRIIRILNKIVWRLRIPLIRLQNSYTIRNYLNINNFDCVIGNSGGYNRNICMQILEVSKSCRIPLRIFLAHNYPSAASQNIRIKIAQITLDIKMHQVATQILTVSQFCAQQIEKTFLFKHSINVIYNGMGRTEFNLSRIQKQNFLTNNANLSPDTFIVGMIANFFPYKGQIFFLKMIKALRSQNKNIVGIIIGNDYDSDYYSECIKFITSNHLEPYIFIKKNVTNAINYVEAYDILCMPSITTESFGLVALEAASYHVPTVAFHTGGIPEVVDHGKCGYIVPNKNSNALANAICELYDNKQLYTLFQTNSYNRWKNNFSDVVMCRHYIEYLKHLTK